MNCPKCGVENRDDASFCGECGAPLAREIVCSNCQRSNPPGRKFCDGCGTKLGEAGVATPDPLSYTPQHLAEKILRSKSALEGERKQVTVLFADVKGSLELAERVDPEEWHAILDRFFQILTDGVHRFEGTVNQYTGDGIMALFGAPIAHEDHAQRACYAALTLMDALRHYADELRLQRGLNFAVRMGLNSGEVVVGKIGDNLRMDYTAQGATVGLAARMEQIAEPRSIYLTDQTARLVSGFFQLRDLGRSKLESVPEPVRVYELEAAAGLRTRLQVSQARGFSRFVGRSHEMQTLETALVQVLDAHGQAVGVVGEAGVGKSRLCLEFVERCRARGTSVYEAHCPAHGKTLPFLPVLQLFRAFFGIGEQDTDAEARRKIAGTLVLLDQSFQQALPLVFDFLDVPDSARPLPRLDPEARQRQLHALVRRIVQSRSAHEPALILVDDLHWIDGASDAVLAQLVEVVSGTRTLLLLNFRPEYQAPWMQKSYYQQLPVQPLGTEAIAELLADLLGTDPSLKGVVDLVRERTRGNPFFIEEVVQSLVESGSLEGTRGAYRLVQPIETLVIPATVQVVLAARIDRLVEREKTLLQTAAVIGKQFSESVLRRVAGLADSELAEALAQLVGAEFIYQEALYPEAVYAFRHPLTQEVAYDSQLGERRRRVHAGVAAAIEELHKEDLDEQAALLAHHWQTAGEKLHAARWSAQAANWAVRADPAEAREHWRRVRGLIAEVPQSADTDQLGLAACTAILDLGWRLGIPEDEAAAVFAEGKALATRNDDLRSLAILTGGYGAVRGTVGALGEQRHYYEEGVRLADQTGDRGLRLVLRWHHLSSAMLVGSAHEQLRLADEALVLCQGDVRLGAGIIGPSPLITFLAIRANAFTLLGRRQEAREQAEDGIRLATEHADNENLVYLHYFRSLNAVAFGDGREALRHARQAVDLAEKLQSPFAISGAYGALGRAHLLEQDWNAALAASERALSELRTHNTARAFESAQLADVSRAALGCGDLERARRSAEEALAIARRLGTKGFEIEAQLALARVLIWTEKASASRAIEKALARATVLVEETGQQIQRPFIRIEQAALAAVLADEATRERELREAHRLFVEMGADGHAARLAKELSL